LHRLVTTNGHYSEIVYRCMGCLKLFKEHKQPITELEEVA